MDIFQSFSYGYKSNKANQSRLQTQAGTNQTKAAPAEQEPKNAELKPGQIIKGEVVDLRYQEVKIRLEPEQQVITARLSGDVPLSIGQEAQFQVTGDSEGRISLKYLPEGPQPYLDQTIKKALEASGLPQSDRNKALVLELLNNKLPIDKQTLLQLVKASVTNREAVPQDLVLLYKNHIPLTPANIRQFAAYQEGSHPLLKDIQLVSKNIFELLKEVQAAQGEQPAAGSHTSTQAGIEGASGAESAGTVLNEQFISGKDAAAEISGMGKASIIDLTGKESDTVPAGISRTGTDSAAAGLTGAGETVSSQEPYISGKAASVDGLLQSERLPVMDALNGMEKDAASGMTGPGQEVVINTSLSPESVFSFKGTADILRLLSEAVANHPELAGGFKHQEQPIGTLLSDESLDQLSRLMEQNLKDSSQLSAGTQAELLTGLSNGTTLFTDVIKQVNQFYGKQLMEQLMNKANSGQSMEAPELRTLLEEVFRQKWTITPEKLAKKTPLEDLYRDLQEDLNKLNDFIINHKDSTEGARLQPPVKNLQENLQFMKELNELFSYVQLPLRLKHQEVHGDLYVFNRKNAFQGKKDRMSVLLHLDMSELGELNIHLNMELNKLQATFFVDDPVSGKILSEHLPELSHALSDKGYSLQARVEQPEQKPDFIKDILEQEQADTSALRYSFDIRA